MKPGPAQQTTRRLLPPAQPYQRRGRPARQRQPRSPQNKGARPALVSDVATGRSSVLVKGPLVRNVYRHRIRVSTRRPERKRVNQAK